MVGAVDYVVDGCLTTSPTQTTLAVSCVTESPPVSSSCSTRAPHLKQSKDEGKSFESSLSEGDA